MFFSSVSDQELIPNNAKDGGFLASRQQDTLDVLDGWDGQAMCVTFMNIIGLVSIRSFSFKGDVSTRKNRQTWTVGTGIPNQQVLLSVLPKGMDRPKSAARTRSPFR